MSKVTLRLTCAGQCSANPVDVVNLKVNKCVCGERTIPELIITEDEPEYVWRCPRCELNKPFASGEQFRSRKEIGLLICKDCRAKEEEEPMSEERAEYRTGPRTATQAVEEERYKRQAAISRGECFKSNEALQMENARMEREIEKLKGKLTGKPYAFICSPFRGRKDWKERAVYIAQIAMEKGFTPMVPHIHFTSFLDDSDDEQRKRGLEESIRWLQLCESIFIDGSADPSDGMRLEMSTAHALGLKTYTVYEPSYTCSTGPKTKITREEIQGILDECSRDAEPYFTPPKGTFGRGSNFREQVRQHNERILGFMRRPNIVPNGCKACCATCTYVGYGTPAGAPSPEYRDCLKHEGRWVNLRMICEDYTCYRKEKSQKGAKKMGYFKTEEVQKAADALELEMIKLKPHEGAFPVLSRCLGPLDTVIEGFEEREKELIDERNDLKVEVEDLNRRLENVQKASRGEMI